MIGCKFSFFTDTQIDLLRNKVFELLENHGVKLDPHPVMFEALAAAGATVEESTAMVRFPRALVERFIEQAPKAFTLGARGKDKTLELPRPDGTFYTRTNTGAHGWIEPETNRYRKVTAKDLADWAKLVNRLENIHFMPYLFCNDVPSETADVHGLTTLLKNTDKHIWVQPYSAAAVAYLIRLAEAAAGGTAALKSNPVVSMIACSLSPRVFKHMDMEIILRSARASLPIHACSLPGAGGTAPATMPGVIVLAAAEILAILAMAQAVNSGTPVIACPIIFSTDMRTGRSLQSSVEALKGASGAVQFIKTAFNLPTHNYGSGSDSPAVDEQSMSERAILTTLMGLSGADILGGAGQIEVATAVSPIQLIVDNEVMGMVRRIAQGFSLDDENMAWEELTKANPGDHFLTSPHTLRHCREGYMPKVFARLTREAWEQEGKHHLVERALNLYRDLMTQENEVVMADEASLAMDEIVREADTNLGH